MEATILAVLVLFGLLALLGGRGQRKPKRRIQRSASDFVVDVYQRAPPRARRLLADVGDIMVAGVSQLEAECTALAFINGTGQKIHLVRDDSVAGHPYAIRVRGQWINANDLVMQGNLGWIPDELAARIFAEVGPEVRLVGTLIKMFKPRLGRNPGLRIRVYRMTVSPPREHS